MKKVCEHKGKYCLQDGFEAEVGNQTHKFCCEQGFEQSLEDFRLYAYNQYKCHVCRDIGEYKGKSCPCGCPVLN